MPHPSPINHNSHIHSLAGHSPCSLAEPILNQHPALSTSGEVSLLDSNGSWASASHVGEAVEKLYATRMLGERACSPASSLGRRTYLAAVMRAKQTRPPTVVVHKYPPAGCQDEVDHFASHRRSSGHCKPGAIPPPHCGPLWMMLGDVGGSL